MLISNLGSLTTGGFESLLLSKTFILVSVDILVGTCAKDETHSDNMLASNNNSFIIDNRFYVFQIDYLISKSILSASFMLINSPSIIKSKGPLIVVLNLPLASGAFWLTRQNGGQQ